MNWTRKATKAVTLSLATGLIVGAGSFATSAAPVAGVSGAINTASVKSVKSIEDAANDTKGSSYNTRSGVSLLLSGIVSGANTSKNKSAAMMTAASEKNGTADESSTASSQTAANASTSASTTQTAQPQASQDITSYANTDISKIGIANVTSYVYIRTTPDANGDYAGKLYPNGEATIISENGDWYQVQSGDVTGYIRKDLLVVGDQATINAASRRVATVTAQTLYVRKDASTDAKVLTMVPGTDDLTITDDSMINTGWVKVDTEGGEGFVSTEFVTLSKTYTYAESKEEEAARLLAEQQEREQAKKAAAEAAAAAAAAKNKSNSKKSSTSNRSYSAASGSSGSSVVAFASQFVGNRYVYGGTSLTNGTDCSGFVMSVYANFGVGLPHSSAAMRSVGYGVSTSDMQAGDIVCYSGHVGIYAGNGTIVNASNPSSGITYTNVGYRNILAVRRIF
jgi:cell wall-associated NlpC family hydrolase